MKPIQLPATKTCLEVIYPIFQKRLGSADQRRPLSAKNAFEKQTSLEKSEMEEEIEKARLLNVVNYRKFLLENVPVHAETWWKQKYIMRDIAIKTKKWPVKKYTPKPVTKRAEKYKFPTE